MEIYFNNLSQFVDLLSQELWIVPLKRAQLLRAFVWFSEDLGWFPAPTWCLITTVMLVQCYLTPSSGLYGNCMQVGHT